MYLNIPYCGNQFNQGNYGFNPQVPGFRQKRTIERVQSDQCAADAECYVWSGEISDDVHLQLRQ